MSTLKNNNSERILLTGGCGFIGSALVKALVLSNYQITVIDNLSTQVHGEHPDLSWLNHHQVSFVKGDICNKKQMTELLSCHDIIIHLAAETGTAQSMYEIEHYSQVNITRTAILADILTNSATSIKKVILASSRAVYGEGKYICDKCGVVYPKSKRYFDYYTMHSFDLCCPVCGGKVTPAPTDECAYLSPSSVYGMSKLAQEHIITIACTALKIPYTILRLQNVYGPGQSLKNPYTGILPVFITQIKKKQKILVFEDGLETRDFVHIKDVVTAICLTLTNSRANNAIFNVGSGKAITVLDIVHQLYQILQQNENYEITYQRREGDIRHSMADICAIQEQLNFQPDVEFENGLREFTEWAIHQDLVENHFEDTMNILKGKGLYSA